MSVRDGTGWSSMERTALPALQWRVDAPAGRLIVFLHGAGERGDDGWSALRYGLPDVVTRLGEAPAPLLVPQCPVGRRWTDCLDELETIVEAALDAMDAPRGAISLTGFSMGGEGAWALACRRPSRFDRLGPVAARLPGGDAERLADHIHDRSIWIAHGSGDERVPVTESDAIAAALAARGASFRYDRFEGAGHVEACARAYDSGSFRAWLAGA